MPRFCGVDSRRRGSGRVHGSGGLATSDAPSLFSASAKSPQQQQQQHDPWSEDEFQLENDTGTATATAKTSPTTPLVVVSPEQVEAPVLLPVVHSPATHYVDPDAVSGKEPDDGSSPRTKVTPVVLPMVSPHPRRRRRKRKSVTPTTVGGTPNKNPPNNKEDVIIVPQYPNVSLNTDRHKNVSSSVTKEDAVEEWSVPSSVHPNNRLGATETVSKDSCPQPLSPRRSPRRRAATRATVSYAEWCEEEEEDSQDEHDNHERSTTRITSQQETNNGTDIGATLSKKDRTTITPTNHPLPFQQTNHDTDNATDTNNETHDTDPDKRGVNHAAVGDKRVHKRRHKKKVVEDVEWIPNVHAVAYKSSTPSTLPTTRRKQPPSPCTCVETRQNNDCHVSRTTERNDPTTWSTTKPIRSTRNNNSKRPKRDHTETNQNSVSMTSFNKNGNNRLLLRFIRTKKKDTANKQGPHFEMVPSSKGASQSGHDESNEMIHWEYHMLNLIRKRCLEEGPSQLFHFPVPLHISSQYLTNGTTNRTNQEMMRLPLCLESKNPSNVSRDTIHTRRRGSRGEDVFHVIGTLQDVMRMHVKYNSGPIPESVIAWMILEAIHILSMTHKMGVLHNDLGLDSFVVARHTSKWHLYMVGFGAASSILTANHGSNNNSSSKSATACHLWHYEHDLYSLANILHLLLTGGTTMAWKLGCYGDYTFESKSLISGNQYLRGSLAWDTLLEALLNAPRCHVGLHFLLQSTNPSPKAATTLSSKDESNDVWSALSHAVKMVEMVAAMGHDVSESRFLDDILDHMYQEEQSQATEKDVGPTHDKVISSKLRMRLPHAPLDNDDDDNDDDDDTTAEHDLSFRTRSHLDSSSPSSAVSNDELDVPTTQNEFKRNVLLEANVRDREARVDALEKEFQAKAVDMERDMMVRRRAMDEELLHTTEMHTSEMERLNAAWEKKGNELESSKCDNHTIESTVGAVEGEDLKEKLNVQGQIFARKEELLTRRIQNLVKQVQKNGASNTFKSPDDKKDTSLFVCNTLDGLAQKEAELNHWEASIVSERKVLASKEKELRLREERLHAGEIQFAKSQHVEDKTITSSMTSHENEGISSSLPNAKSIRERIVSFHQQLVDTQEQLEEKEKKMHQREAQIQTGLAQTKQLQTIKSQVANMKEDAMQLFLEKEETLRQRKREMKACVEKQHMSMVSEMNEKQKQLDSYRTYLSSKAQELEETKRVMQTQYDGVVKALQQKESVLMEGVKKLEAEKHAYQRVWSRTQNAQAMGYLPNSNVPNSEHCNNMTPHDSSGRQRLPVAMQGFNEGFATNLAGQLKVSPPLADHKVPSVPEKQICSLQSFAVAPGGTRANRKPKKTRKGHLMPQVMIDSSSESEGE